MEDFCSWISFNILHRLPCFVLLRFVFLNLSSVEDEKERGIYWPTSGLTSRLFCQTVRKLYILLESLFRSLTPALIDIKMLVRVRFSLLNLKQKSTSVFIAVIENCVGREGKALSYYCSETRKSFERRQLFHVSPLQAPAHQSLPRLSPI